VSGRLGGALAEYLRRHLSPGQRNFVLIEGVSSEVAEGMSRSWDNSLPNLAIVSPVPHRFGTHALTDGSATQLRNQPGTTGVVLVLCDGEQVPDRQSLNLFQPVSPSILLDSAEGMGILSQQPPPVDLDGPARAVREAIVQASPEKRPSAMSVAAYLDRLATGADPLRALPVIGGFTDHVTDGQRVDSGRVSDNLELAAQRTSEDLLKPTSFADLRRRAERVLAQRPGLHERNAVVRAADEVMAKLEAGSADLLSLLRFDEAREILEQRSEALSSIVRREIRQFRASLLPNSQAASLPWNLYEQRADELSRGPLQRVHSRVWVRDVRR
jgi:hypothetical protein